MGFAETVPCEHCGKGLRVSCDTDGSGRLVESVADCTCPDARWRRGACIDCGVPVHRRSDIWPRWAKRCPTHDKRNERKRARESYRRRYAERAEQERRRCRAYRRRRVRANPRAYEMRLQVKRARYREELRIRGKRLKQVPREVRRLRDRLVYRLRVTEGWKYTEIGEVFGLTWQYVWHLVRDERERRESQQQTRAA